MHRHREEGTKVDRDKGWTHKIKCLYVSQETSFSQLFNLSLDATLISFQTRLKTKSNRNTLKKSPKFIKHVLMKTNLEKFSPGIQD